jgi:hypothetical protein
MQERRATPRDPLVGQFVIVRAADGRPTRAGRIRSRTIDGNYQVTVMTNPRHGEVVTEAQMAAEQWEFFINEGDWRRAFASATTQ